MAKEIPYFRFYPGEWLGREITMLSMEAQGLFINICAIYWANDCDLSEAIIRRRFNHLSTIAQANVKQTSTKQKSVLDELFEFGIIDSLENGNISIKFLDEQYEELMAVAEKRSNAGRLGGAASAKKRMKQTLSKRSANVKQTSTYKDKDKDKDKDIVEIIGYLNFVTGKNFSEKTAETCKHISARLSEGRTIDDFKKVIDTKSDQWLNDGKMNRYLRPETLFNPTNFEAYLNERNDLPENGQEREPTDEEKYELVKTKFFAYWDRVGNLKDALDYYGQSPYIKQIYTEIKKAGLKPNQLSKGPNAIPGLNELVAKLKVGND